MHSTNDNKPWIIVNNKYFIYKKYILTIKNNTNERRKQSLLDMLVLPSCIRSHWHKPAPRRIRSPRLNLYRASKSRFSVQHDILFHITQDMNAFSKDYAAEYKWGWIILRAPALKSMNTFIHILFLSFKYISFQSMGTDAINIWICKNKEYFSRVFTTCSYSNTWMFAINFLHMNKTKTSHKWYKGSQNTNDLPRNFDLLNLASMNAKFI